VTSRLSEGGRRMYSGEDLTRMRIICFLREAGFPLASISQLLRDPHPEGILSLLLEEQERSVRAELAESQKKLDLVETLRREIKGLEHFSLESIGDIAHRMKQKQAMRKFYGLTLAAALPLLLLEIGAVVLWASRGISWPFSVWAALAIPFAICFSVLYYWKVAYICPRCHSVFKPPFREIFWAAHTPRMRRLTCPDCGQKGWCLESLAPGEESL